MILLRIINKIHYLSSGVITINPNMVKKFLKAFCLITPMVLISLSGSAQDYWLQRAGGLTPDEGTDISIDDNGYTYTTGYFTGTATFGIHNLSSSGLTDIFLTRVSSQGLFQWARKAGGPGADRALSVKTDGQGNSFITGFFYQTATFGSQNVTSSGAQDIFIAKYDNAGTLAWVTRAGGTGADIGNAVNIDANGNVVITGEFTGSATFGSTTLTSQNNSVDIFVAKLDPNGDFLWAKQGSAPAIDRGIDVACDPSGNVYATGSFSDTITFDVTHNNNIQGAIFLIKYDSDGNEQWFRKAGGGSFNIVRGITVDNSSNVYITGDFGANIIFFGTPNTTLSNTYTNRIYITKYNSSGTLTWAKSAGSASEISSKNITLDSQGNPHIVGTFKCRFSEYADQYGQGTFNSVGYWDVFVAKYNSNGVWQMSRSSGGKKDDYGVGIAVNNSGQMHITGSFTQDFYTPYSTNLVGYNLAAITTNTPPYCSSADYSLFRGVNSAGNSDILIAKNFDPQRAPFDYYKRTDNGCDPTYEGVCLNSLTCPDTVHFCQVGILNPESYTYPAGPDFTYQWSTGSQSGTIFANTSGYYSVIQTSEDGCFVSEDTVYVSIHPNPSRPTISDSKGVNSQAIITDPIELCAPDSVQLTGEGTPGNTFMWSNLGGSTVNGTTLWTGNPGTYIFTQTDPYGCRNTNLITVYVDTLFEPVVMDVFCLNDTDRNDSITLCEEEPFSMYLYDTISNPNADVTCIEQSYSLWTITTPSNNVETSFFACPSDVSFTGANLYPYETGTYQMDILFVRENRCDTDSVLLSTSLYIEVLPTPGSNFTIDITGDSLLCPGDSILLVASGSQGFQYTWQGSGITGSHEDSVWVFVADTFTVNYYFNVTNQFGCSASGYLADGIGITYKPQPTITMTPANGLICPGDSVLLACNGVGYFQWQGPSGIINGSDSAIYVTTPGSYFCVRSDADSCNLVSNTVQVNQYTTPFLLPSPSGILCEGESITINVITNPGSTIQWQSPLSGNNPTQVISQEGTYTCMVSACGIQTFASVGVDVTDIEAEITPDGPIIFCTGDSVMLQGNNGPATYLWQPGNIQQQNITVYQSDTYTLITADTAGCMDTTSITIDVSQDTILAALEAEPNNILCNDDSVEILVITNPGSPVQWQPPLSGSSLSQVVSSPGTYTCMITSCGSTQEVSLTVIQSIVDAVITAEGDLSFCEGDSVLLKGNPGVETYQWQPGNFNSQEILVMEAGSYTLTTFDSIGCSATSNTVVVNVVANDLDGPEVTDTSICPDSYAVLQASSEGTVDWFDDPDGANLIASGLVYTTPMLSSPTTYYLIEQNDYCKSDIEPVTVSIDDCEEVTIPNVFTPNGDKINDIFKLEGKKIDCFNCKIFNRWGRLLYEWNDPTEGWDGTNQNNGKLVEDGVYYYVVTYCDYKKADKQEAGFIELLNH